jgi:hypothetical protein
MGAEAKAKTVMKLLQYVVAMLLTLPIAASAAEVVTSATDRTIQFLTNVHTGISMNDAEWLSSEARSHGKISAHGGLTRLVDQTTSFAKEFNGVKSIVILDVSEKGKARLIRARVQFFDEKRRNKSPAAAERGDMIWTFLATQEDGKWKLQF